MQRIGLFLNSSVSRYLMLTRCFPCLRLHPSVTLPSADHTSILCSLSNAFKIVLVINSEQFSIVIAFAFFTAPLTEVNFLILILNLIFMASWANGLCTQGWLTHFVAIFGKSEQVDMALFPLVCSCYYSCFPDFSSHFETTAS